MTTSAAATDPNPFGARATLAGNAWTARIYRLDALPKAGLPDPSRLPFTVKVLLENVLRRADASAAVPGQVVAAEAEVAEQAAWQPQRKPEIEVWTAVSGSAQIVTSGVKTIPHYREGELTPGGPGGYSDAKSWYDALRARTAIGLTRDGRTLILFTVDERGGSAGMTVGEVAEMLIRDGVYDALNLDGGGSTSLAMQDSATGEAALVNVPTDPKGRAVASSLAVLVVDP